MTKQSDFARATADIEFVVEQFRTAKEIRSLKYANDFASLELEKFDPTEKPTKAGFDIPSTGNNKGGKKE